MFTPLVYSQPGRQKLRNIERELRVGFKLNSNAQGGDVVRVEGKAEIVEDAPPAIGVPGYVEKYRDAIAGIGFDPEGFARFLGGAPNDARALACLVVRTQGKDGPRGFSFTRLLRALPSRRRSTGGP